MASRGRAETEEDSGQDSDASGTNSETDSRASSGSTLSSGSSGSAASSDAEEGPSEAAKALVLERDAAAADAYERLTIECPLYRAKTISAAERDRRALCESTLTYGEILLDPFETALRKIKHLYGGLAAPGGKFVDIGSGAGKPVFAAALLHQWDVLQGIEVRGRRAPARSPPLLPSLLSLLYNAHPTAADS